MPFGIKKMSVFKGKRKDVGLICDDFINPGRTYYILPALLICVACIGYTIMFKSDKTF